MDVKNPKKSELKRDVTYLVCPDSSCGLFYDTSRLIPCESQCPRQDELVKIVRCSCDKLIELPGNHSVYSRVEHVGDSGCGAWVFRMSCRYRLIYNKPR